MNKIFCGGFYVDDESMEQVVQDGKKILKAKTNITPESIQEAVDNYLEEHPVSGEDLIARAGVAQLSESITIVSEDVSDISGTLIPKFTQNGGYITKADGTISISESTYGIINSKAYSVSVGDELYLNNYSKFKIQLYLWSPSKNKWVVNGSGYADKYTFTDIGTAYVRIISNTGIEFAPSDFDAVCILKTKNGMIHDIYSKLDSNQNIMDITSRFIYDNSKNKFNIDDVDGGVSTNYATRNNYVTRIDNGVEVSMANYNVGVNLYGSVMHLKEGEYVLSAIAKKAKDNGELTAIAGVVIKGTTTKTSTQTVLDGYNQPKRIYHKFTVTQENDYVVSLQCKGNASDYSDTKMQFTNIMLEMGRTASDYSEYGLSVFSNDVEEIIERRKDDIIPAYWKNSIATAVDKVRNIELNIGLRNMSFIFVTDTHWVDNAKVSPILINYLTKKLEIPLVIFGGDAVTAHYSSKSEAVSELRNFFDAYNKDFDLLSTEGNHDDNSNNNSSNLLTQKELYPLFRKRVEYFGDNASDMDAEGRISVVDNKSQKVRIVSFAKPVNASQGLINKICNLASELPQDWTVVYVSHNYWWSTGGDGIPVVSENSSLVANAIGDLKTTANATIAYWQVGHMHYDYSAKTDKDLLIVATTTDACANRELTPYSPSMTLGTDTEQAFDIVQIDLEEHKIYMTRVGAGSDREFSY